MSAVYSCMASIQMLDAAPPAGYRDGLLLKAVDLADRLIPAFDTPSGIPLSWVNLRKVSAWHCRGYRGR